MKKFNKPVYISKPEFTQWYFDNAYFNNIEISKDSLEQINVENEVIDLKLKLTDDIVFIPMFMILNPDVIPDQFKKDDEISPANFSDLRFVNANGYCLDSEGNEYLILDPAETMYLNIQSREIYLIDNDLEKGIMSLEIPIDPEHSKQLKAGFVLSELQISMIKDFKV